MSFHRDTAIETRSGKSCLAAFIALFFSASFFAQTVTPQQQAKIDSLMAYVNLQLLQNKIPDPHYVDSCNAVIRAMNVPTAVNDTSATARADSVTLLTKQSLAGSTLTVPAGKRWTVKRVYVNDGGAYNVLTSLKYDHPFSEGEKIAVPSWSSEGELLNGDQSGFTYILQIEEADLPRGKW